jgi:chorismate synthase
LTWDESPRFLTMRRLRCADATAQQQMIELIDAKREAGDTLGGIFEVVARGVVPDLVRTRPGI